jgi:hypothetical protein
MDAIPSESMCQVDTFKDAPADAKVLANATLESLCEERAQLISMCEQLFGLLIRFSGFAGAQDLEWVRADVELLREEFTSRALKRTTMCVGETRHVFNSALGLEDDGRFDLDVQVSDPQVLSCQPIPGDGTCELVALGPGTAAVTMHLRRKRRGLAAFLEPEQRLSRTMLLSEAPSKATSSKAWSQPDEALIVTVEAELFAERTSTPLHSSIRESPFQRTEWGSTSDSTSRFRGLSGGAATIRGIDNLSTTSFMLAREIEYASPDEPTTRKGGDREVGFLLDESSFLDRSITQKETDREGAFLHDESQNVDRSRTKKISEDMSALSFTTSNPACARTRQSDADLLGCLRDAWNEEAFSLPEDVEGLTQVAAQFRCADETGKGIIRRCDLARLLKALDAGEWTDARVDRLLRAAGGSSSLAATLRPISSSPISYEEFLRWLFGPSPVDSRAVSTA